jgi:hypothetical protein
LKPPGAPREFAERLVVGDTVGVVAAAKRLDLEYVTYGHVAETGRVAEPYAVARDELAPHTLTRGVVVLEKHPNQFVARLFRLVDER